MGFPHEPASKIYWWISFLETFLWFNKVVCSIQYPRFLSCRKSDTGCTYIIPTEFYLLRAAAAMSETTCRVYFSIVLGGILCCFLNEMNKMVDKIDPAPYNCTVSRLNNRISLYYISEIVFSICETFLKLFILSNFG